MWNYLKTYWLRIGVIVLVIFPVASFLLANLLLLAYLFWPRSLNDFDMSPFTGSVSSMTIIAHGTRADVSTWAQPLAQVLESKSTSVAAVPVNWSAYAANPLLCAIDGSRIGERIGEQLSRNQRLQSVHLIAHSCGAFVIYNICRSLKQVDPDIVVQTTFLDPVSIYGPRLDYGISHFGDCADYSEAYIETGDKVRGSNQLLPHAHTYDVTGIRQRQQLQVNPHVWPSLYYLERAKAGEVYSLQTTPELASRKPIGELEVLSR